MRYVESFFVVFFALLTVQVSAQRESVQDAELSASEGEARLHFKLGSRYYDTGRFTDAQKEFQVAYDISQKPALLYNVYLAAYAAGDFDSAVSALETFLPLIPKDQPDERAKVEARLKSAKAVRDRVAAGGQAPEAVTGEKPAIAPTETETPTTISPSEPEKKKSIAPWILVGVGGAMIIGGVVTGIMTLGAKSDFDELCSGGVCRPGFEDKRSEGETLRLMTDIFLFSGIAIAGAGIIWAIVAGGKKDKEPSGTGFRASPYFTAEGGGLVLGGSF